MEDLDKVYQRVLEMQKNIENASTEEQTQMMNELFEVVSKIEQSLFSVQKDLEELNIKSETEIENQINEE